MFASVWGWKQLSTAGFSVEASGFTVRDVDGNHKLAHMAAEARGTWRDFLGA